MKKEVLILVGNIGAGKSTLVKKYVDKGHIVISRDSLRYGIGGGKYIFNTDYESVIWATELTLFEEFLTRGVNIIVDEVGINISMRARYIEVAKAFGYKVKCIVLPKLSKEESVNRRMKDPHGTSDRKIWEGVWEKFDNMYEEPSLDEGFNKIIKL